VIGGHAANRSHLDLAAHLFCGGVRGGRILNRNIGNPTREPLPSSLGRGLLYAPGKSRDTGVDIA